MPMDIYEILGYVASVIVAVSLMMSSIVKLRWWNLLGAALFSLYGFLIGALPVGFLNLFIAIADVYYLYKIYSTADAFEMIHLEGDMEMGWFSIFLNECRGEIDKLFPSFRVTEGMSTVIILRNMIPVSVFSGRIVEDGVFYADIDYVLPQYRDFKTGIFLYGDKHGFFEDHKITKVITESHDSMHSRYLERMGFEKRGELWERAINN